MFIFCFVLRDYLAARIPKLVVARRHPPKLVVSGLKAGVEDPHDIRSDLTRSDAMRNRKLMAETGFI